MKYEDIPIDFRQMITAKLTAENGEPPTKEEVADEYEQFLIERAAGEPDDDAED